MIENLINKLNLTEQEVLSIVSEWYTNGMYADILQDEDGNDLEEITQDRWDVIEGKLN
tara:strand:- start:931 stop:1104 length:174 start_codon:yes stop_codon:yes gene_type:complete